MAFFCSTPWPVWFGSNCTLGTKYRLPLLIGFLTWGRRILARYPGTRNQRTLIKPLRPQAQKFGSLHALVRPASSDDAGCVAEYSLQRKKGYRCQYRRGGYRDYPCRGYAIQVLALDQFLLVNLLDLLAI